MRGGLFNCVKAVESKKNLLILQLFSFSVISHLFYFSVCVPDCSGGCACSEEIFKHTFILFEQTLDILCIKYTQNYHLCKMLNFIFLI